jgi:hypothetical protein
MKARSLLHLLLMRARAARDNTDPETTSFLTTVCESMEIEFQRGCYEVKWTWKDQTYSLNLSNEDLNFYARGDNAAKPPSKGVRAKNWAKAGEIWRRIATISEQDWTHDESRDPMGLMPEEVLASSGTPVAAVSAILVAAIGALLVGHGLDAVVAVLIAGSLTLLGGLSRGVSPIPARAALSGAVIGIGACIPATFNVTPFAAAGATVILLLAVATERWRPRSAVLWCSIGLSLGLFHAVVGDWVAPPGIFLVVAILGIHVLMPNRFGGAAMSALVAVMIIATTIAFLLPSPALFPIKEPASLPELSEATVLLSMAVALLSVVLFMTDWFFGELRSTVAWIGLGYFAVAAIAAQVMAGPVEAIQLTAMVGFLLAAAGRVVSVWRTAVSVARGTNDP